MNLAPSPGNTLRIHRPPAAPRVVLALYKRRLTAAERDFAVGIPAPMPSERTPWWLWVVGAGWVTAYLFLSSMSFNDEVAAAHTESAYYSESPR